MASRASLFLLVALLAVSSGCNMTGQWAADLYIGPNFPSEEDVETNVAGSVDSDFDGEFTIGARGGRWLNWLPEVDIGGFLDVSGVFQEVDDVDFTAVPITLLPMARVNLMKDDEFPGGRLQPHVGLGPSLSWSEVDGSGLDDDAWDIGFDARAGVSYGIIENIVAFLEYRATVFEPDFEDSGLRIGVESVTHHVLFGAGIRF